MISSTSERTRRCRTSLMTCDAVVCANPGLAGPLPGLGQHPFLHRAVTPPPRPHLHRRQRPAATVANARRDQRAPFLAGATPPPQFDQRSYILRLMAVTCPVNRTEAFGFERLNPPLR